MKVDIICNVCKKVIQTVEKDTWDYHAKDICRDCKTDNEVNEFFNKHREKIFKDLAILERKQKENTR